MTAGGIIRTLAVALLVAAVLSCASIRAAKTPAEAEFDTGLSLFNRGHFGDAIPHFERATEHDPDFGEAYLYLGRSYLSAGRWAEALYPLRTAFRLAPEETRNEIAEIILDVLIKRATEVEPDAGKMPE